MTTVLELPAIDGLHDLDGKFHRAHDRIQFYLPLEKSLNDQGEDADWVIDGDLSSERTDLQGQRVFQQAVLKGLPTFYRLGGHIDYDHLSVTQKDPKYILGVGGRHYTGTDARGNPSIKLPATLFKSNDYAKGCWQVIEEMARLHSAGKSVGVDAGMFYSIGGYTTDPEPGDDIKSTLITHVAVTPYPVNPDAAIGIAGLAKSFGVAFTPEVAKKIFLIPYGEELAANMRALPDLYKALSAGAGPGLGAVGGRALVGEDLESKPCRCGEKKKRKRKRKPLIG